jgi:hypothetical protein
VVNRRLSRLAGRPVNLKIAPTAFTLLRESRHSVRPSAAPLGARASSSACRPLLILSGADEDLRLAWHAGLGEKRGMDLGVSEHLKEDWDDDYWKNVHPCLMERATLLSHRFTKGLCATS